MRTLKFIVNNQSFTKDPNCNFNGLVPGTSDYIQAEISFSPEWDGCIKVVSFESLLGREYEPQILRDGRSCMIPAEALERRSFKMKIIGKKGTSKITTNKITIEQNGGRA